LLVFLVVPAAIEVPASVRGGSARTQNLGWHSKSHTHLAGRLFSHTKFRLSRYFRASR